MARRLGLDGVRGVVGPFVANPAAAPASTIASPSCFNAAAVTAPPTKIKTTATFGHDIQQPPSYEVGDGKQD